MSNPPDHPSLEELAELVADPQPSSMVRAHLAACATCRCAHRQLTALPAQLAEMPIEPMPDAVLNRLSAAIRNEAELAREGLVEDSREEALRRAAKRTALGTFGENPAAERKDFSIEARHRVAALNRARHGH